MSQKEFDYFSALSQTLPVGVYFANKEGVVIYANEKLLELSAMSKDDVLINWAPYIHPDDRENVIKIWQNATSMQLPFKAEYRLRQGNGEYSWVLSQANPVKDESGFRGYAGTLTEITDRVRMEEELVENEHRLMLATNAAQLGVWDYVPDSNVLVWNDRMYKLYGVDRESFRPSFETWSNSVHPDDYKRAQEEFAAALNEERELTIEFRVVWPDGTIKHIQATAAAIKNAQGIVTRFIGVNRDITEEKIAMQKLKETAVLKSRFLDIAAHELRTPVTAFGVILDVAQKKLELGHQVTSETLSRLKRQSDRISRLVIDLLDVSRLERGVLQIRKESTDLTALINQSINEIKLKFPNRNITFTQQNPVFIEIDAVRIDQVVSNLLDNACKYSSEESSVEVFINENPQQVNVSVQDHGPGIPEEQVKDLFSIFSRGSSELTDRSGGLGLGLFICNTLVELHGGKIFAVSHPGQGSTFSFTLPKGNANV